MSRQHALLSPSAASRWLTCTPSARLEEQFAEVTSEFAEEGTLAHSLCELLIKDKVKPLGKAKLKKELAKIEAHDLYKEEMNDYAEDYAVFVMERFAEAQTRSKDAFLFLERSLKLDAYVPESFGHVDVSILSDDLLDIIDYKHGKGVPVKAENNKQMMLYALGAYEEFSMLFDITRIRMTIYQPRIDNISSWEIPVSELLEWANTELKERAALAFDGAGEYAPGDNCRFCKAKGVCRANADMNLKVAANEFKQNDLLTDGEIADILTKADNFYKWLEGVEGYALHLAVTEGKKWPGYKLVEGKSNRRYDDPEAVATLLLENKFTEEQIFNKKLRGLGDMAKEIGKLNFEALLTPRLIKPTGKATLAPLTDKRPELNSIESAVRDFENV